MGRIGEVVGAAVLIAGVASGCTEVVEPPAPSFAATGCEAFVPHFAKDIDPVKAVAHAIQDCYNKGPLSANDKTTSSSGSSSQHNVVLTPPEKDGGKVTFFAASTLSVESTDFADKILEVGFSVIKGADANEIDTNVAFTGPGSSGAVIDWSQQRPHPQTILKLVRNASNPQQEYVFSAPLEGGNARGQLAADAATVACVRQQAFGAFAQLIQVTPDLQPNTPILPVPSVRADCGSDTSLQ